MKKNNNLNLKSLQIKNKKSIQNKKFKIKKLNLMIKFRYCKQKLIKLYKKNKIYKNITMKRKTR